MSQIKKRNVYRIYSRNPNIKIDKDFSGVGVGVKPVIRKGILNYQIKGRHINKLFPTNKYGLQVIPAGHLKPTNRKVFNIKRKSVKSMPKGKGKGPGRPRKRGRKPQVQSSKAKVMAKSKRLEKQSLAQLQREYKAKTRKSPTRTINMHGSLYTLYDDKPRTKSQAQSVRQKLKAEGKAAFINPRKRKTGTQWFVYQKSRAVVKRITGPKVSKRTGIPTSSINMHGKKYDLHDDKPRNKTDAQTLRKKLIKQGKASFLNPRKRKSGTEYFVYEKLAERRLKATSPKKSSPRSLASKRYSIKQLEAELRKLKKKN